MANVTTPDFTDSVQQKFFIESQGGSQNPVNYLDRFPDTVYTKAIDSVLVSFLYALLGPVGVGQLTVEYLQERLALEDAGASGPLLDACYTSPFSFARLAEETYTIDTQAALLPAAQRDQILQQDASFRNRAQEFLKGARAGGTLRGVRLVAKAGLDRNVDVIENYTALYDQFSDERLGLTVQGATRLTNEFIILPRQEKPQNSLQTISFSGAPTAGWFTIIVPGPPYQVIPVTTLIGSNVITVPSASRFPAGVYVSLTTAVPGGAPGTPVMYAMSGGALTATTVSLIYPPSAGSVLSGTPFNVITATPGTGTFLAYVGNAQTILLAYNASAFDVQSALNALPIVGGNYINVTGGPLPTSPIEIQLLSPLSDTNAPVSTPLIVALAPDPITGVNIASSGTTPQLNIAGVALPAASVTVTTDIVGVSADGLTTTVAPEDVQGMELALDQIRPVTSIFSITPAAGTTLRQPSSAIFAGSSYTEVVRYVTGNPQVKWPITDGLHWIQSGIETEGFVEAGDTQQNYQGFHNIVNAYAYTEAALTDAYYSNPTLDPTYGTSSFKPVWSRYWDTMIGLFSSAQVTLYPVLANFQNLTAQYPASQAAALAPEPLVISSTVNGTGIINRIYPVDYLGAQGAPALAITTPFWASAERNAGVDYLELDLGTPQAINFIYFEATSKPYLIDVAYDTLDQSPQRRFVPVTITADLAIASVLSLAYNAVSTNPWSAVSIYCQNSLGLPIYSRFIRIGFTKSPGSTAFAPTGKPILPFSIEVRNLRVGRNAN